MDRYKYPFECALCKKPMVAGNRAIHCSVLCATLAHIEVKGPDECWPWLGGKYKIGYGRFKFRGKTYKPYRIMCQILHGDFGNLCAMHSCDNKICCNPLHLSPGTYAENIRDMDQNGRRNVARGSKQGHAIFNDDQILDMRARREAGESGKEIAKAYNTTRAYVYTICQRRIWTHI